jgi:hypothetical protein
MEPFDGCPLLPQVKKTRARSKSPSLLSALKFGENFFMERQFHGTTPLAGKEFPIFLFSPFNLMRVTYWAFVHPLSNQPMNDSHASATVSLRAALHFTGKNSKRMADRFIRVNHR